MRSSSLFSLVLSALLSSDAVAAPVVPAQLQSAYWLDGSAGLDVSGLSFCGGELLAVADKDPTKIYRVALGDENGSLAVHAKFRAPEAPEQSAGGLLASLVDFARGEADADFEGISCDAGKLYLVSERHNRIAGISRSQSTAVEWLTPGWTQAARERGYLQKLNAGSEGLVKIGGDFWVALEREPRGLLRIRDATDSAAQLQFFEIPPVAGLDFRGRAEDIAGLAYYDNAIYTLERNAFAVCRRSLTDLRADWCVDYRGIEESPQFVYAETEFGKGEGLAVNREGIFVVLDNNNVGRAMDAADKRALLLHLTHPQSAPAAGDFPAIHE